MVTDSPPIVHSRAAPPAALKNERRVLNDPDPMTAAESSTHVLGAQVRTYWFRIPIRVARRGLQAGPRVDRRRDRRDRRAGGSGGAHPPPGRHRGRRLALVDHLALR